MGRVSTMIRVLGIGPGTVTLGVETAEGSYTLTTGDTLTINIPVTFIQPRPGGPGSVVVDLTVERLIDLGEKL